MLYGLPSFSLLRRRCYLLWFWSLIKSNLSRTSTSASQTLLGIFRARDIARNPGRTRVGRVLIHQQLIVQHTLTTSLIFFPRYIKIHHQHEDSRRDTWNQHTEELLFMKGLWVLLHPLTDATSVEKWKSRIARGWGIDEKTISFWRPWSSKGTGQERPEPKQQRAPTEGYSSAVSRQPNANLYHPRGATCLEKVGFDGEIKSPEIAFVSIFSETERKTKYLLRWIPSVHEVYIDKSWQFKRFDIDRLLERDPTGLPFTFNTSDNFGFALSHHRFMSETVNRDDCKSSKLHKSCHRYVGTLGPKNPITFR